MSTSGLTRCTGPFKQKTKKKQPTKQRSQAAAAQHRLQNPSSPPAVWAPSAAGSQRGDGGNEKLLMYRRPCWSSGAKTYRSLSISTNLCCDLAGTPLPDRLGAAGCRPTQTGFSQAMSNTSRGLERHGGDSESAVPCASSLQPIPSAAVQGDGGSPRCLSDELMP